VPAAGGAGAPRRLAPPLPTKRPSRNAHLIAFVFLPFAVGFYLSYLFRTINAAISGQLVADLALGASDLGLLTSVYFLTFAAAQIPVGMLLDRYGPRRVQSAMLVVAAGGAVLFGTAHRFLPLLIGRALIGFGVAASLSAGLKAIVLWFPKQRVAFLNGTMIMLGAFGAVTATAPAQLLTETVGWRGLFELLAAMTVAAAVIIYVVVPEPTGAGLSVTRSSPAGLKAVYADPRFWRLAPLAAASIGSAWALQGLWAGPWLTDVEGLDRKALIAQLLAMAVALSVGALLLGTIADRMRRHGIGPQRLFVALVILFVAAQLTLILQLRVPSCVPWCVVAIAGAGTVLTYTIVAEFFPKELAGRGNAALNVFQLSWAFVVQYATGLILVQWPRHDGHYPVIAYRVAFSLNLAVQIAALAWFEWSRVRALGARAIRHLLGVSPPICKNIDATRAPHERALVLWTECLASARLQASTWRFAAAGLTGICIALGLALTITAGGAEVTPWIVQADRLDETVSASPPADPPSDAQIAYFLARFVKNVRSLSTDPVVVRANWTDALGYVTARGARMLGEYATDTRPFMRVGLQSVTVEIIYIVRASANSFEIHWRENIYGKIASCELYTGVAEIILKPGNSTDVLKNPIGLYVHGFRWSCDGTGERGCQR
jgi:type IV secretory pathway TrbF-like protein/predicted MFS family arabinose efflux permease